VPFPRKPIRQLRFLLEYVGLRGGLWLIKVLPLRPLSAFVSGIATLAFILLPARRRIAIDNLLQCGVANDHRQATRIARDSYRHFAILVMEALKAETFIREDNWQEHVDAEGISQDVLEAIRDPNQGLIVATAHLGNWEVAAQVLSYLKPVVAVARRMNNPYTNSMIQTRKTRHRFRMIPGHEAGGAQLLKVLSSGEILAMLVDQHARRRCMKVNFMGRPAFAHTSLALLHFRSRAPILVGYCLRTGPMKYRLESGPLIFREPTGDKEEDTRAIIEAVNLCFEEAIRQHPEQYLWAHRRWRDTP
jgi:KDO2-lipid IV(A) lauroyltransferase